MKKALFIIVILSTCLSLKAQTVGFSYFFPKNGYFGSPIAPVNFSLPLSFGEYIRITPGIGMNNIGGMSLSGLDEQYNSARPLVGPFQSLKLSLTPSIVFPVTKSKKKVAEIELMGGYLGFTSFNTKLMNDEFDDMLIETHSYQMVESRANLDPSFLGHGWVFGLQVDIRLSDKIWAFIAGRYYIAGQSMNIEGSYEYLKDGNVNSKPINFDQARMNYEGFEITIGGGIK